MKRRRILKDSFHCLTNSSNLQFLQIWNNHVISIEMVGLSCFCDIFDISLLFGRFLSHKFIQHTFEIDSMQELQQINSKFIVWIIWIKSSLAFLLSNGGNHPSTSSSSFFLDLPSTHHGINLELIIIWLQNWWYKKNIEINLIPFGSSPSV